MNQHGKKDKTHTPFTQNFTTNCCSPGAFLHIQSTCPPIGTLPRQDSLARWTFQLGVASQTGTCPTGTCTCSGFSPGAFDRPDPVDVCKKDQKGFSRKAAGGSGRSFFLVFMCFDLLLWSKVNTCMCIHTDIFLCTLPATCPSYSDKKRRMNGLNMPAGTFDAS